MTAGVFKRRYQGLWTVQHGQTARQAIIGWDTERRQYEVKFVGSMAPPFYLTAKETGTWIKGGKGRRVHR